MKKFKYNPDLSWEENYKILYEHHTEETIQLMRQIEYLEEVIESLRRPSFV